MTDVTSNLLPLDSTRTVAFTARGARYIYFFPRISCKQWERCFKAIEVSFEDDGAGGRVQKLDSATAFMDLARSQVERVEGYAGHSPTSTNDFMAQPEWRRYLPSGHVRLVAEALQEVSAVPPAEGPVDPMRIEISLAAVWGTDGEMRRYSGLLHRFAPPSIDHERRLNRAMSEVLAVGGSRTNKEIIPAKHPALVALYDELIESVEGYGAEGQELQGHEKIVEFMDGHHKFVAARQLFERPEISKEVREGE